MQNKRKEYQEPIVFVLLADCDVITTSGAVELPVIPADSANDSLYDLSNG